ncbi:MAG: site-2 protease family protein [Chloroflexota bacterium]
MLFDMDPATLIASIVVLLVAFPIHEFAHAWTATQFGDPTPEQHGRLTLNPLAHLDLMGSLMLLVAHFGWAKPVPVNPYLLRRNTPSALMWVSLAGPMSNFLMAILAAIPFRMGLVSVSRGFAGTDGILPSLDMIMVWFVFINLGLMLFNLIPLAPLDGDKILEYFLPPNMARSFETIRPYGPLILLALILLGNVAGINVIGSVIGPPMNLLFRLLVG